MFRSMPKRPSEPSVPPPMRLKFSSSGAMVRPLASRNAPPRQTSMPPSVTMNAGMPMKAMRKP